MGGAGCNRTGIGHLRLHHQQHEKDSVILYLSQTAEKYENVSKRVLSFINLSLDEIPLGRLLPSKRTTNIYIMNLEYIYRLFFSPVYPERKITHRKNMLFWLYHWFRLYKMIVFGFGYSTW